LATVTTKGKHRTYDRRSDEQLFEDFNGIVGVAAAGDFRAWYGNSGAGDGWLF
jgi:hypothetical protein